ncbi:hypothetical protein BDZ89DRAFT_1146595 [Hymenopellis radicata]|nr:hypothetical protein BDZ89DRAFT_1146595 [Hymenopellis radicata]
MPPRYSRHCFNQNERTTFGVRRAQRIVQRAVAELRGVRAAREWLLTRLEACHVTSKEELAHVGWLSYHRRFAAVFRLALGLSLSGGNWPRVVHLTHTFTQPREVYQTNEAYDAHQTEVALMKQEAERLLLRCADICEEASYNRLSRPGWVSYDTGCQYFWRALRDHNDRERAFDRALGVVRNDTVEQEHDLGEVVIGEVDNSVIRRGLGRYTSGEAIEWYWAREASM